MLLHILGHGLAKSVLFLGAGRILQLTGTSRIDGVRGLAARPAGAGRVSRPRACWRSSGCHRSACSPANSGIVRAGFAAGLGWATAAALLLVLVIAAALVGHTSRMLLGAPRGDAPGAPRPTTVAARRRRRRRPPDGICGCWSPLGVLGATSRTAVRHCSGAGAPHDPAAEAP